MRVLAIGGDIPYRDHDRERVTAVNIVLYQLMTGLAELGHEIMYQPVFNEFRTKTVLSPSEEEAFQHLGTLGVQVLTPIYPAEYHLTGRPKSRLGKILSLVGWGLGGSGLKEYYPAVVLRDTMQEKIRTHHADAVLTIWSPEGVAATDGIRDVSRVAYHGDLDFGPAAARLRDRSLFGDPSANAWSGRVVIASVLQRLWLARFKRAHLHLMRDLDVIANVTACNADFYAAHGHPRSVYVNNVWVDPGFREFGGKDPIPGIGTPERRIKILGHVGKVSQTGSTYGLRFLLADVLPELDRVMMGLDFEVQVIGGGEVVPALRSLLRHPRLVLRGFVEDLDTELRSSDVFLLLNNAGSYQAAYTRHVVAWAQGLCLVVHENSCRAIPEIRHMENALVGSTPEEIARMIHVAATNQEVNRRVRKGGRATYERYFTPAVVAGMLADEIERAVSARG